MDDGIGPRWNRDCEPSCQCSLLVERPCRNTSSGSKCPCFADILLPASMAVRRCLPHSSKNWPDFGVELFLDNVLLREVCFGRLTIVNRRSRLLTDTRFSISAIAIFRQQSWQLAPSTLRPFPIPQTLLIPAYGEMGSGSVFYFVKHASSGDFQLPSTGAS